MASTLTSIKVGAATLSSSDQKMIDAMIKRMQGEDGNNNNNNDDEPATEKRGPGRPKKIANSDKSKVAKSSAKDTEKRKPGRPRKTQDEDEELTKPRGSKTSAKNAKTEKPATRKPAAKNSEVDFSDMDKAGAKDLAEKWKLNNPKLLKNSTALLAMLKQIHRIATNEKRDVSYVEKMAKKADVELKFGQGRPPTDDAGLKRRILVKMANEDSLSV